MSKEFISLSIIDNTPEDVSNIILSEAHGTPDYQRYENLWIDKLRLAVRDNNYQIIHKVLKNGKMN